MALYRLYHYYNDDVFLLVSWICTTRWLLAIIGFFGLVNVYAMRVNLSVAMVCMINNTAVQLNLHSSSQGRYDGLLSSSANFSQAPPAEDTDLCEGALSSTNQTAKVLYCFVRFKCSTTVISLPPFSLVPLLYNSENELSCMPSYFGKPIVCNCSFFYEMHDTKYFLPLPR